MGHAFSCDDESTWASELVALLENNLPALRSYREEQDRYDERYLREGSLASINYPGNPWTGEWERIIEQAGRLLIGSRIVAYHCTRLCAHEIDAVKGDGLKPLSSPLVEERVAELHRRGELSDRAAREIRAKNMSAAQYRTGMIWFVFSTDILRAEAGVDHFFTYWGGEAIYRALPEVEELCKVGKAAVVETELPTEAVVTPGSDVATRITRRFLASRALYDLNEATWEGYTRQPAPARRVYVEGEPAFHALIGGRSLVAARL